MSRGRHGGWALVLGVLGATGSPAAAAPLLLLDFDQDDGGLVAGGDPRQWEWGTVDPTMGPGTGWLGDRAWATRLDAPTMHEADDWLALPALPLDPEARTVLRLVHWTDIAGPGDSGRLEHWDGADWQTLAPLYGYPDPAGFAGRTDGWAEHWFDLTGIPDLDRLRLRFTSDATGSAPGWVLGGIELREGDPVPPRITVVEAPEDTSALDQDHDVQVRIEDDLGVASATLWWVAEGGERTAQALSPGFDDRWVGSIPLQAPGTAVVWWVTATDGENEATTPGQSFRVFLPGPTGLTGPTARVVDQTVPLAWTPPDLDYPVLRYLVWREDQLAAATTATEAEARAAGPVDAFAVSALVRTPLGDFESDRSEAILVDVAVPRITALHPDGGWQGDRLRVEITGAYLLLAPDETAVDLGPGIDVQSIEVVDATRLVAELTVDPDAAVGPRSVVVHSGAVSALGAGAFTVTDGATRPRLTALEPAELVQGAHSVHTLSLSAPPESLPEIDLGDGIVVESIAPLDDEGRQLSLQLAAAPDAAPGPRPLVADDGVRELAGVTLTGRRPPAAAGRVCSATGGPVGGLVGAVLAGLAAALRRPRKTGLRAPRGRGPRPRR